MSDEYEDAGGAEAPFEDPVSMSSGQWFGEPGSGPDLSPEQSIGQRAAEAASAEEAFQNATPSGFDYRDDPTAKVTDVLAASAELEADDSRAAADDERLIAEFDAEQEQLDWQEQEDRYSQEQAGQEALQSELLKWARNEPGVDPALLQWLHAHPEVRPHLPQLVAAAAEEERQAAIYERTRQATEAGNQPAIDEARAMLAEQQREAAAGEADAIFAAAGVQPEHLGQAQELAEVALQELLAAGHAPSRELAETVIEHVGGHVAAHAGRVEWTADRRGDVRPRPVKLTAAQFQRDFGGHLPLGVGRPSVRALFFNGGEQ